MHCKICKGTFDKTLMLIKDVCLMCGEHLCAKFIDFRTKLDDGISQKFHLFEIDEELLPKTICTCRKTTAIPFDYFTEKAEVGYNIILTSVCKICNGYREIKIPEGTVPIFLRARPLNVGMQIDDGKEFYDSDYFS